MSRFQPKLTITNAITRDLTQIERARGFLEAATLSNDWIARMRVQNYVVNSPTGETVNTLPGPADVPPLMQQLVQWINAPGDVHPVLLAGIAQFFESLCPSVTRRSLQRDLKSLVTMGILRSHGEARATRYSLKSIDL